MLPDQSTGKQREHPGEDKQEKKKPVEILKTDKGDTRSNPLHSDLSEQPEKENKAVRNKDTKDQ